MAGTTNGTGAALRELDEQECLRLISPGGVGRVAFTGSYGPTILPVNYRLVGGLIVFRTRVGGVMDEDLRTGIKDLEFKIAFEVDEIDRARHEVWSVLVQGPIHHITADELAQMGDPEVESWAGGSRERYLRITPQRVTGRRIQSL